MYRILICDDEKDIVRALRIYLLACGEDYEITETYNGRQALSVLAEKEIDLVLLDVMMPVMDGIDTLSEIRKTSQVPVIFLTARSEAEDKVMAFNMGADAYITKPFNKIEVAARVKYQLRRNQRHNADTVNAKGNCIVNGPIVIDDEAKTVKVDGEPVNLTPTEYAILKLLAENAGAVLSAKEIYRKVWDADPYGQENPVIVHIRHLREKIEILPKDPKYILTAFGHGYYMEELD